MCRLQLRLPWSGGVHRLYSCRWLLLLLLLYMTLYKWMRPFAISRHRSHLSKLHIMLSKTVIAVAACILAITSSTALADRCYCYDISGSPLYKDTQQECCTRAGGVCSMRTSIAWTLHPKARNPSKLAVTKTMPVCDASNRNPASSSYIAEQTMQTGALLVDKAREIKSNHVFDHFPIFCEYSSYFWPAKKFD